MRFWLVTLALITIVSSSKAGFIRCGCHQPCQPIICCQPCPPPVIFYCQPLCEERELLPMPHEEKEEGDTEEESNETPAGGFQDLLFQNSFINSCSFGNAGWSFSYELPPPIATGGGWGPSFGGSCDHLPPCYIPPYMPPTLPPEHGHAIPEPTSIVLFLIGLLFLTPVFQKVGKRFVKP